jgi:hypothetical protein
MSVIAFKKAKGKGIPKAYFTIHTSDTASYAAGGYAVDLKPSLDAVSAALIAPVGNLSGFVPGIASISGAAFKVKLFVAGASGSPLSEAASGTNVSGTQNIILAIGE